MNITTKIQTTHRAIITYLKDKGKASVRIIAAAIQIPKSTVHNHLKRIKKRQKYPESHLWDTPEGAAWLRLFVLSTLYNFGLKSTVGADKLSLFFKQLNIDTHVAVSPTSLRKQLREMEQLLSTFQTLCETEAAQQTDQSRPITAAADETFFGALMMLVMMDLSSGYLLLEDIADDRTFDTWWESVKPRLAHTNIEITHLITDRAKALIKLATNGVKCESGADLFHGQQTLSRGLGSPLKRRSIQREKEVKKAWKKLSNLLKGCPYNSEIDKKVDEIITLTREKNTLKGDKESYKKTMKSISTDVHAFDVDTQKQQSSQDVEAKLETHADTLEVIEKNHFPDKKTVPSFRKQTKSLASCVDVWWYFVLNNLLQYKLLAKEEEWLLYFLLPTVYWHKQMMKTKDPWRRKRYKDAWISALKAWELHPLTAVMSCHAKEEWQDWALWMVENFHRSSSAVEGRNGTLSQMYHTQRGLTPARLKALTVIFNYDHYRADGKTPAEKLFKTSFPDLFGWISEQMGELPMPRQGKQRVFNKPLNLKAVPA